MKLGDVVLYKLTKELYLAALKKSLGKFAKPTGMVIKKLLILSTAGSRDGIVADTKNGAYVATLKAIGLAFALDLKAFTA